MQQLQLGEAACRHFSNELYAAGIYIGKSQHGGLPSLLFLWKGCLVEVVYRVYRAEIAFFHFPSEFHEYAHYLPEVKDLI